MKTKVNQTLKKLTEVTNVDYNFELIYWYIFLYLYMSFKNILITNIIINIILRLKNSTFK